MRECCVFESGIGEGREHSPPKVDQRERVRLVEAGAHLDDVDEPDEGAHAREAAGAEDGGDAQLGRQRDLEAAGERAGDQEDGDVGDQADDVVGEDEGALVEALAVARGVPEQVDRAADEDL